VRIASRRDSTSSAAFTVPASYTRLTVTYWWYSDTNKTTNKCQDYFTSRMQTTNGALIGNMQQSCNVNVTNNWVVVTFDVSRSLLSFKGLTKSICPGPAWSRSPWQRRRRRAPRIGR